MLPSRSGTHFAHLARSIVYQQLTGKAAATIHARVCAALGDRMTPENLVATDDPVLRGAGLSAGKLRALRDLGERVLDGRLLLDSVVTMPDTDVVDALVQVRGIGPWTAQMFLMFRLGRPDVLPVLDLGVRKGAQRIYGLRALPDAERLERIANAWRPWRSVASWYCWRVIDDAGGVL